MFVGIGLSFAIFSTIRSIYTYCRANTVNVKIHRSIITRLIRAPLNLYYERTPTGRILNRLSKDITVIDKSISNIIPWVFSTLFLFIADLTVTIYGAGYFILPGVAIFLLFTYAIQAKFLRIQRELVR